MSFIPLIKKKLKTQLNEILCMQESEIKKQDI